jgi:hypothetical protein
MNPLFGVMTPDGRVMTTDFEGDNLLSPLTAQDVCDTLNENIRPNPNRNYYVVTIKRLGDAQ